MKRSRRFSRATSSVPGARQFVAESLSALEPEVTVVYPTPAGRVRIEVVDGAPGEPAPLRPPPSDPHGRGLLLVASLAHAWGVKKAGRRVGKTIWFELAPAVADAPAGADSTRSRLFRRRRRGSSYFAFGPLGISPTLA
jgi:hypothetical protein